MTPDNVVDFLNMFYGGTEVVSAELAQHIRETSGSDACYTRAEFEAAFGTTDTTLSGGALTMVPTDPSLVASLAFGVVGTAMFTLGM